MRTRSYAPRARKSFTRNQWSKFGTTTLKAELVIIPAILSEIHLERQKSYEESFYKIRKAGPI